MRAFFHAVLVMVLMSPSAVAAREPTIVSCKFETLPLMLFIFRGGMGATNNTVQVGASNPVELSVGSTMMTASLGEQEYSFSLRPPFSVTVIDPGSSRQTYYGECISSL